MQVLTDDEEKVTTVQRFAKKEKGVKSGLFLAFLDGDARVEAEIFQSAAVGDVRCVGLWRQFSPFLHWFKVSL